MPSRIHLAIVLVAFATAALAISPYDIFDSYTPPDGYVPDVQVPRLPTGLNAMAGGASGQVPRPLLPDEFNWSQAGHDNACTGYNPLIPQSDATYLWFKQQTGSSWMPWGGYPIEGDDYVVFVDHNPGNISCYDRDDGSLVWQQLCGNQTYRGRVRPPQPTIFAHNGVSYVCALGYQSGGGQFICWNLATGVEAWRTPITLSTSLGAYKARPLYVDGYLYFTLHSEAGAVQPIYKVDAGTGSTTVLANRSYECWGGMCTDGSYLYVTEGRSSQARLHKYDMTTGSEVAVSLSQGTNQLEIPPAYYDGRVYTGWSTSASSGARIVCFNAADLVTVWTSATMSGGFDSQWLAVDCFSGGNVYVSPYATSGYLYALRQSDGGNAWGPLTLPDGRIYNGGLAVTSEPGDNHRLYLTPGYYGVNGSLIVLDADSGTLVQDLQYPAGEQMFCGTGRTGNGVMGKTGYGSLYYWSIADVVSRKSASLDAILAPASTVDSGQTFTPTVLVRNKWESPIDSFDVFIEIDNGVTPVYSDHATLINLGSGESDTIEFTDWTPDRNDSLTVTAWTWWTDDERPADDTAKLDFLVRVRDVAVTTIYAPVDTLDSAAVAWPSCMVENHGNLPETFNVQFRVGLYNNLVLVSDLAPGASDSVVASESLLCQSGTWVHRVEAVLPGDLRPADNVMVDTFVVRGTPQHDVAAEEILAPTGFYAQGAAVVPSARVANYGGVAETFRVWFTIWDTATDARVYHDSLQVNLGGGGNTIVNFLETQPLMTVGPYAGRCSTYLASDQNQVNNVVYEDFAVTEDQHNVLVRSILVPSGTVDSGLPLVPTVLVQNGGLSTENFPVYIEIGSYLASASVLDLGPGERDTIEFVPWRPNARDSLAVTAWTLLAGDERPEDDTLSQRFFVRVRDVGAEQINSPTGSQPESTWVYPEVRVRNFGLTTESFDVEFRIGLWLSTATVTDLEAGDHADVAMPDSYYTQVGVWLARAQTFLTGDNNPSNDVAVDTFTVAGTIVHDAAAIGVVYPAGTVQPMVPLTPRGAVANYGLESETFAAHFRVLDSTGTEVYAEHVDVTLASGEADTADFLPVEFTEPGSYSAICSTFLAIDQNWTNNVVRRTFTVGSVINWPEGWVEVESMPSGASGKPVKRGGWLAIDGDGMIYATKGYKTPEFFRYDPLAGEWISRADVPNGIEEKPPREGSKGVSDGAGTIYMTKGNNTLGFWKYDVAGDTWTALPDVPLGPGRKKVKKGTDLAYVDRNDTGYVYLLKGYKTEFYRYNTVTGEWATMPDAPAGAKGKWDKGSWLCLVPGSPAPPYEFPVLYAHQAKYYNRATSNHYMFVYNASADTWFTEGKSGMPLLGLHSGRIRKKKAKDGSSGDRFGVDLYSLKGGNTQQFFKYDAGRDTWQELDTMPTYGTTGKKKRVKYGSDIVHFGDGAFFALKGNKTRELWRYVIPRRANGEQPERSGAQAGRTGDLPVGLTVAPNPLVGGRAMVRYSLPQAGPASIVVYDVAGRGVLRRSVMANRTGAMALDVRSLSAGVYLVRVETTGWHATRKLVIE